MCISYRWIPCSNKLPEESGEYLVTTVGVNTDRIVSFDYFSTKFGWSAGYVIAWLPVPEVYREEYKNEEKSVSAYSIYDWGNNHIFTAIRSENNNEVHDSEC